MYRILVADDEGIMLEAFKNVISSTFGDSCIVETAKTGRAVTEIAETFHPDIVFMDIHMPVMNGYEATRQIRALTDPALSGITILAITANAFDEDRKKVLECGMDGFLSKPIIIEELIDTLQKNLD